MHPPRSRVEVELVYAERPAPHRRPIRHPPPHLRQLQPRHPSPTRPTHTVRIVHTQQPVAAAHTAAAAFACRVLVGRLLRLPARVAQLPSSRAAVTSTGAPEGSTSVGPSGGIDAGSGTGTFTCS